MSPTFGTRRVTVQAVSDHAGWRSALILECGGSTPLSHFSSPLAAFIMQFAGG